MASSSLL
jgi:hypothetical protein